MPSQQMPFCPQQMLQNFQFASGQNPPITPGNLPTTTNFPTNTSFPVSNQFAGAAQITQSVNGQYNTNPAVRGTQQFSFQ